MRPTCFRAFTLVELMAVILIIVVLAGLLLAFLSGARESAEDLDTKHRMNAVLTQIKQLSEGGDQAVSTLQEDGLDIKLTFVPLREILIHLRDSNAVNFSRIGDGGSGHDRLPPNICICYSQDRDFGPKQDGKSSGALEHIIGFRKVGRARGKKDNPKEYYLPGNAKDHTRIKRISAFKSGTSFDLYFELKENRKEFTNLISNDWLPDKSALRPDHSPIGESLHQTLELLPQENWTRADYYEAWPAQAVQDPGSGHHYTVEQLQAWPESSWSEDRAPKDGDVPTIWDWPWGRPVINRFNGNLHESYRLERDLSQLDPLQSMQILQAIGLLPEGEEGRKAYRQDRSPKQAWNDRWGYPLVVAYAAYLPPRYDFLDPQVSKQVQNKWKEYSIDEGYRQLLGGRDYYMKRSRELYGFNRAIYISVGSIGSQLPDPEGSDTDLATLISDWADETADEDSLKNIDRQVLRQMWQYITHTCEAEDWDETAWDDAPWNDVRIGDTDIESRCFVTAPVVIAQ